MPIVDASAYVDESAQVIGDVVIGAESSVWMNVVIRGDVNQIRIGKRTNIQDLTMVHVMRGTHPTNIGDEVTVGHSAVIHGCTIEDRVLIGMARAAPERRQGGSRFRDCRRSLVDGRNPSAAALVGDGAARQGKAGADGRRSRRNQVVR